MLPNCTHTPVNYPPCNLTFAGICWPVFAIIFGDFADAFGTFGACSGFLIAAHPSHASACQWSSECERVPRPCPLRSFCGPADAEVSRPCYSSSHCLCERTLLAVVPLSSALQLQHPPSAAGQNTDFMDDVRKIALDFVYLAIGSMVGSFLQVG